VKYLQIFTNVILSV